jgi:hypothetical protein
MCRRSICSDEHENISAASLGANIAQVLNARGNYLNGERFRERLVEELAASIGAVQLLQFGEAFVTARTVINHIMKASILYPMIKTFLRLSILVLDTW